MGLEQRIFDRQDTAVLFAKNELLLVRNPCLIWHGIDPSVFGYCRSEFHTVDMFRKRLARAPILSVGLLRYHHVAWSHNVGSRSSEAQSHLRKSLDTFFHIDDPVLVEDSAMTVRRIGT